jgi:hypothetical protein
MEIVEGKFKSLRIKRSGEIFKTTLESSFAQAQRFNSAQVPEIRVRITP